MSQLMAAAELRDALRAIEAGDRPAAAYHLASISAADLADIERRLGPVATLLTTTATQGGTR